MLRLRCAASRSFLPRVGLMDSPVSWWIATIGRLKPGWRAGARFRPTGCDLSGHISQGTLPAEYDAIAKKDYLSFHLGALPAATGVSQLRQDYEDPLWLLLALSGTGASDCLREPGESDAGTGQCTATGDGAAADPGRIALAADSPVAGGESAAGRSGNNCGRGASAGSEPGSGGVSQHAAKPHFRGTDAGLARARICRGAGDFYLLLFGLAPAVQASRTEPGVAMKAGGRGATAGRDRFLLAARAGGVPGCALA